MHSHVTVQALIPIVILLVPAISELFATRSRLRAVLAALRRLHHTGFHTPLVASNLSQPNVGECMTPQNVLSAQLPFNIYIYVYIYTYMHIYGLWVRVEGLKFRV